MASEWRYRGRVVTTDDVTSIRRLIAENPGASRRRLSEKLCAAWPWKQAHGALRDMVCRGLLLMLHRAGEIELPPIRFQTLNPFVLPAHNGIPQESYLPTSTTCRLPCARQFACSGSTPSSFGLLRDNASLIWIGGGSSRARCFNTSAMFSPAGFHPVKNSAMVHAPTIDTMPLVKVPVRWSPGSRRS